MAVTTMESKRIEYRAAQAFSLIRQECAAVQVEALAMLQAFLAEQSAAAQSTAAEASVTVELAHQMIRAYDQPRLPGPGTMAGGEIAAAALDARKQPTANPGFGDALVVTEFWPPSGRRAWYRSLFTPSVAERLKAWQALAKRLPDEESVSEADLREITQQYDHLKAWQSGMAVKIGVFMTLFVILGGIIVQYAEFLDTGAAAVGRPSQTMGLYPYLIATYWGAVGACAAALYRLNQEAASKSLRLDEKQGYALKPVLGGILGLLVTVLAPALLNDEVADFQPRTLSLMAMVAALCGLCEASFFRRVKAVTASILGIEKEETQAQ